MICRAFDLDKGDFVGSDVLYLNVNPLRHAPQLRQSSPAGSRQDQVDQQFKILVVETSDQFSNSVLVRLTRVRCCAGVQSASLEVGGKFSGPSIVARALARGIKRGSIHSRNREGVFQPKMSKLLPRRSRVVH